MKFLPLFVGVATLTLAVSIPRLPTQNVTLPDGYGHYATFVVAETGFTFELSAEGYTGTPQVVTLDDAAISRMSSLSLDNGPRFKSVNGAHELDVLARRDVCARLATCYGQAADGVETARVWLANTGGKVCSALGASVGKYLSANNYANLNSILQNAIVGLVINFASTEIGNFYENSKHSKIENNKDTCNVAERETLARDFAGAITQFCESIKAAQDTTTDRRFQAGTVSNDYSIPRGDNSITQAFIAAQAANFGPICYQHGIEWKRFNEHIDSRVAL